MTCCFHSSSFALKYTSTAEKHATTFGNIAVIKLVFCIGNSISVTLCLNVAQHITTIIFFQDVIVYIKC